MKGPPPKVDMCHYVQDDGIRFIGSKIGGKFHGQLQIIRPDGSFEENQYVDGFKNGHSFDKKANGTIQESKVKAGKPNGDVI